MNVRWPLVASIIALFLGAGLAALVLAFCGEEAEGPGSPQARATARVAATRTAVARTRTPRAGTPVATGTPREGTPVPGEEEPPPVEEEPPPVEEEPPPTEESPPPEETPVGGETPTPGSPIPTATPGGAQVTSTPTFTSTPTSTPTLTSTPTPVILSDLIVLGLGVFHDQIVVVVANVGEESTPAGTQVDIAVRNITSESILLEEPLLPGDSFTVVLSDQIIYQRELVTAQVDPDNLVAEMDETNNSLVEALEPDIVPDLAVTGLAAVGATSNLAVDIANTTEAPIRQAGLHISVSNCGSTVLISGMNTVVDLAPLASTRIEVFPPVSLVKGVCVRVAIEPIEGPAGRVPDADPNNNVFEGIVP